MSADPVAVLEAIVAEVAGAGQPFSADSYLPAHLIHDARMAIEAEHKEAAEWKAREAHEALLLARLAKSDEVIASLRAENSQMASTIRKIVNSVPFGHSHEAFYQEAKNLMHGKFDDKSVPLKISVQPATTKYEWKEDAVWIRGPKQPLMTVAEPVKYDPQACAESVRDMKECDA